MQQYRMDLGEEEGSKKRAKKSRVAKEIKKEKSKFGLKTKGAEGPVQQQLASVGATLKEAREAKKMSLTHAAAALNMRLDYLKAIEKDHFKDLPCSYVAGFVRTYATLLHLNGEALIDRLQTDGQLHSVTYKKLTPIETRVVPSQKIVLASAAVLLLIGIAFGVSVFSQQKIDFSALPLLSSSAAVVEDIPQTPQH